MSCGVVRRHGSDPALLWLWHRPVATAPIQPLAWEPPYAEGVALEMAKRPKKKEKKIAQTGFQIVTLCRLYTGHLLSFLSTVAVTVVKGPQRPKGKLSGGDA